MQIREKYPCMVIELSRSQKVVCIQKTVELETIRKRIKSFEELWWPNKVEDRIVWLIYVWKTNWLWLKVITKSSRTSILSVVEVRLLTCNRQQTTTMPQSPLVGFGYIDPFAPFHITIYRIHFNIKYWL